MSPKKELKMERVIVVLPLEDAEKAEELWQSGEWCRPKYDDYKHVFVMIRRKDKLMEGA